MALPLIRVAAVCASAGVTYWRLRQAMKPVPSVPVNMQRDAPLRDARQD